MFISLRERLTHQLTNIKIVYICPSALCKRTRKGTDMVQKGTKKLYYKDTHQIEFTATVLSRTTAETGDKFYVVLDQTAFFPEEGGQKPDAGYLQDYPVLDVQIDKEDVITHTLPMEAWYSFEPETEVTGIIDWNQRFDFTQQHSGEHIISGLVHSYYGFDNVGFHLGYEEVTMDFNGILTWEQLRDIEKMANQAIYQNLPVIASFPNKQDLEEMTYRSKLDLTDGVRIVRIPGIDACACCAPHVDSTGQIGIIKIIDMQSHRGGVRLNILCGKRALRDYNKRLDSGYEVSALLSAKPLEIGDATQRLLNEAKEKQERINSLQATLLTQKIDFLEEKYSQTAHPTNLFLFEKELDPKAVRDAINKLVLLYEGYCGIFVGDDETGYTFVVGSQNRDCKEFASILKDKWDAKGGGAPQMVQGNLTAPKTELLSWFETL